MELEQIIGLAAAGLGVLALLNKPLRDKIVGALKVIGDAIKSLLDKQPPA